MALIWTDPRQVLAGVRRHLGLIDVLVAAALTTGNLVALSHLHYRDSVALAVASSMSCTGAVAFRRVAPQAAMVLAVTSVAVYQGVTRDPQGSFVSAALVLVGYMFGRSVLRTGRHVQGLLVLGYALAVFEIAPYFWQPTQPGGIAGTWLTAVVLPTGVGALVERRDRLTRQLSTAAGRLRDEQRIRADRAAAEERNRAARELHDVVAHHLSVMAIQAAAARTVADRPDAATAALRTVTQSGREVLTDLRRITGVLRRSDDQWGSHPPRLDQLDMLIARTRAAGVTTQLRVFGDLRVVPAAIDLAAYRIIQEALTNVVKHAATTTASVKISISANALALAVTNGGADRATLVPRLPTSGQGLIGMRERIDLYGGQLETGHQAGGGYCVRATIPLGAASPARPPHANAATVSAPTHRLRWNAVRQHLDVLLAGAWLIALEVDALTSAYRHGSLGLNMVVVGTMAAIGVWRRRWPLVFVVAVGGLALLLNGGLDTLRAATVTGTYILLVPVFTVAVYESRARAVAGLLVWEAGVITAGSITNAPAAGIAGAAVMAGIVWVAGRVWRSYRHLEMDLAATVSRLETESSQSEQLAVANQRAVIAQDLDRLVTRHVVSMVVQAQAAQSHCSPETIRGAAGVIEVTGRQALAEMREILGVLRVHGVPADLSARPSMDALSDANRADRHHSFATLGRDAG
jgi:signal transduction histidine kinase